jgi:hypothetical protein
LIFGVEIRQKQLLDAFAQKIDTEVATSAAYALALAKDEAQAAGRASASGSPPVASEPVALATIVNFEEPFRRCCVM